MKFYRIYLVLFLVSQIHPYMLQKQLFDFK